jgi:hypothetical protein
MLEHGWLHGKIHQARELLAQDIDLYEISRTLQMEEVEYTYLRMNGHEPADVHPDNIAAGKAPL